MTPMEMKHPIGTGHLPRRGQYELFTFKGITYCYDDPGFGHIATPPDMFEWIRSQDPELWHGLDDGRDVAYYLAPKLYFLWKLKFA